jgi:hypothetical protein
MAGAVIVSPVHENRKANSKIYRLLGSFLNYHWPRLGFEHDGKFALWTCKNFWSCKVQSSRRHRKAARNERKISRTFSDVKLDVASRLKSAFNLR